MRPPKWAVMSAASLSLALVPAVASANSVTGLAEYTYEQCNEGIYPQPRTHLLTNLVDGVMAGANGQYHFCWNAFSYGVNSNAEEVVYTPNNLVSTTLGFLDTVDGELQTVWAVTSQLFGQVESLTGIRAAVSVGLSGTDPNVGLVLKGGGFNEDRRYTLSLSCAVGCVGAHRTPPPSGDDSVSKFKFIDDAPIGWYPETTDGRLNGKANLNLYEAIAKPNDAWDFLASSQWSSATPGDGYRITKVLAEATPEGQNVGIVEADPLSVAKYGSAGSFNLGASLSGEAKFGNYGGGGSFNIGRTWNFAEGTVGGGVLSGDTHYTQWQAGNKAGSTTAKSTAGVETWKVPTDGGITLWYSASAWVKG